MSDTQDIAVTGSGSAETVSATVPGENIFGPNEPAATPAEPEKPSFNLADHISEDLREKEYFKNILKAEDPTKELVNQFHNAQSLIGKSGRSLPKPDASAEEWEKYYSSTRPESTDAYEFDPVSLGDDQADLAEFLNSSRTDEFMGQVKGMFHKYGIDASTAKKLVNEYDKLTASQYGEVMSRHVAAQKELSDHFDQLKNETFGNDADKVYATAEKFIQKFASEKTRELAKRLPGEKLPNEALIIIAEMAHNAAKQNLMEDSFSTASVTTGDINDLRAKLREVMSKPEYRDDMSPMQADLKRQVTELSKKIAGLSK